MDIDLLSDPGVGYLHQALPIVGSAIVAVGAFIFKIAGGKVKSLSDELELHKERILILEQTYVSREDLENVIDSLQKDLKGSFERAHSRIDEIYRNPRKDL